MPKRIVVGTRGSALALLQSEFVIDELVNRNPRLDCELKIIRTKGDMVRDIPLSQIGTTGLFVREIERAMLSGEIDLAVHSMKDVPTVRPQGLVIGAVIERVDPRDVLICKLGKSIADLPPGARLGTSSLRRRAQLLASRPDLLILDLRGNVDTRIRRSQSADYDGIILAAAGVTRLGYNGCVTEYLPADSFVPAAGQGALAVELRADDDERRQLVAALDHRETAIAVLAERAFLAKLEEHDTGSPHKLGGCQVPIGVYGTINQGRLRLIGLVATLDGQTLIRDSLVAVLDNPERTGGELAEQILAAGGDDVLREVWRDR